jgi:hypothetical protein
VKDENGDMLADSLSILNRWKNYFCHFLNLHGVSDVRQTEMHTSEPLVPKPSSFNVQITIENLKTYILVSPHIDQVLSELIQVGGDTSCSEIHRLINSIWNKEELPQQQKYLLFYLFIKRVIKTLVIIEGYHCYLVHTKFYPMFLSQIWILM